MESLKDKARSLLSGWRGDKYVFGVDCFDRLGELAAGLGKRVAVITSGVGRSWGAALHAATRESLTSVGVSLSGELIQGVSPNTPFDDVYRLADELAAQSPDAVITVGGGSNLDAAKAAIVWWMLRDKGDSLEAYFGAGKVSAMLSETGRQLPPMLGVQIAAGSSSHLTKYSCATNMTTHQKYIIIDPAIVPARALFDYRMTCSQPASLTMDGGLDGIGHCNEVWMGIPAESEAHAREVCLTGIALVVKYLKRALADPEDVDAREGLGLGTDLGGQAIMIGGTNGPHLTSFSLVDVLSHGRACALMGPYFLAFFAPAIEDRVRQVGEVYRKAGYLTADLDRLSGRDLGRAVGEGMIALSHDIGFPTTLAEVDGFTPAHIDRVLAAAKDPSLASKLENMPIKLSAEMVDDYLRPVLEAARTGEFSLIRSME
jgi:alcohol dehydrogenase